VVREHPELKNKAVEPLQTCPLDEECLRLNEIAFYVFEAQCFIVLNTILARGEEICAGS
jgi:hypothetical protein